MNLYRKYGDINFETGIKRISQNRAKFNDTNHQKIAIFT